MIYVVTLGMANKDKNEDNKERERENTQSVQSKFVQKYIRAITYSSSYQALNTIINRTSNHVLIILL